MSERWLVGAPPAVASFDGSGYFNRELPGIDRGERGNGGTASFFRNSAVLYASRLIVPSFQAQ